MPLYASDWSAACGRTALEAVNAANCSLMNSWGGSTGLVDLNGAVVDVPCTTINTQFDNILQGNYTEIAGISVDLCLRFCRSNRLVQKTDILGRNIQVMTTWLFPFIILVSQLPYETESFSYAILSAFLALGSPLLATYSLVITALNRRYIFHRFRDILAAAKVANPLLRKRAEYAATILAETQQVPMRACQEDNWLSSLICVDKNTDAFWEKVKDTLAKNRRGWTPSLVTQVIAALLSYLFAYVTAKVDTLDKDTRETGLYFATSIVWSWMFAVVPAAIWVGTQVKPIDTVFTESSAYREESDIIPQVQFGLFQATNAPSLLGASPFSHLNLYTLPTWMSFDVLGFERTRGPIFNFARRHTSLLLVHHVSTAFEKALEESHMKNVAIKNSQSLTPFSMQKPLPQVPSFARDSTVQGQTSALFQNSANEAYEMQPHPSVPHSPSSNQDIASTSATELSPLSATGISPFPNPTLEPTPPMTYPPTTPATATPKLCPAGSADTQRPGLVAHAVQCELPINTRLGVFEKRNSKAFPSSTTQAFFLAMTIALVHQWGTTGAALYTAYATLVVGLGCRSGSYLLYGTLATVSGALLVASSILSHDFMAWNEERSWKRDSKDSMPSSMLWRRVFAVLFRWAGIFFAIGNAVWLFTFSIMEDIGFFQNCWCQGDLLESLRRGYLWSHWIPVFAEGNISTEIYGVMTRGFVGATMVCVLVVSFFAAISYLTYSVKCRLGK
ncbi:hypothetical protein DL96DRAFT_1586508 [Flagelloscypha sp. PMI_526]|nr:hypothetical protein DL96DRAFT_1586508 [Flagelloscypha sp. PMI_526]